MAIPSSLKIDGYRQDIEESRHRFLDDLCGGGVEKEKRIRQNETVKKKQSRKISFKVRKTSSTHRKSSTSNIQKTTISATTVAELTSKFNEIIEKNNTPKDELKIRKFVQRLNSFSSYTNAKTMKNTGSHSINEQNIKETWKPSIKKKPILEERLKLQLLQRKPSYRILPLKINETIENRRSEDEEKKEKTETEKKEKDATETNSLSSGFVKAAIKNFEKRNSQPVPIKSSMVELLKIRTNEKAEVDRNRRRSCKPDIAIPNTPHIHAERKQVSDFRYDSSEVTNAQIFKSEPSLVNLANLNEQNYSSSLSIVKSPMSFESDTSNIPRLSEPEEKIQTNCESSSDESHTDLSKSDEKESTTVEEGSCYSIKDIINQNFPTIDAEEVPRNQPEYKPNTSFLWKRNPSKPYEDIQCPVGPFNSCAIGPNTIEKPDLPPFRTLPKDFKGSLREHMAYEELDANDGYEPFDIKTDYEIVEPKADYQDLDPKTDYQHLEPKTDVQEEDQYEFINNQTENIYETLPCTRQDEPLPETPQDNTVAYAQSKEEELASNCYESIYNNESNSTCLNEENNYESIYFRGSSGMKEILETDIAGSIVSSEQKTNSLYGTTSLRSWNDGTIYNSSAASDMSSSDKSEWVDVSETEYDGVSKIFIIKEAVRNKKNPSWSEQYRRQWTKSSKSTTANDCGPDSDSDHHYETLRNSENEVQEDCFDNSASDIESDDSFENLENDENTGDLPLPAAPNSNDVLTRLAKHMRNFSKNLSLTKNDISKSLTRIARRKSKNDVSDIAENNYVNVSDATPATTPTSEANPLTITEDENNEKNKHLNRKGLFNKIRRSIIMSPQQASEITSNFKGKSTFYLTPTINVDDEPADKKTEDDSGISLSPIDRNSRNKLVRPQEPPPPAPITSLSEELKKAFKDKRSTSWYAEVDLCKTSEIKNQQEKRSNTCWYDEIGLYQNCNSTPSTSSAENSGTNTNVIIRSLSSPVPALFNQEIDVNEKYYNLKNEDKHNNKSATSLNSNETKTDVPFNRFSGDDIQMRLQNEPLYQFYDAAVLDYVCHNGISDLDSDNYEDVGKRLNIELMPPSSRPTAMELVSSKRNSFAFAKTLWCEIPEVLQSSVLSTLSSHQRKLQEAKFEMITSEASYLNSLNVLKDHFIDKLKVMLTDSEYDLLFSKIEAVRQSSDKLLLDLERCWQDNVLLHGVCDIIQKHAEEDFSVYIPYCENHTLLDQEMKKLRDRTIFADTLKQLEASPVCQCLSLYSFLMLPLQRITRWPLLLDAVLKRLEQHDPEYLTCQYVLATISKIVSQCNEAARNKDREREIIDIESKMEFGKGVPAIELAIPNRWLVRSGSVVHMLPKSEELKLTFGKKFSKTTLNLFLFNDLLIVAKPKNENAYTVLHYCLRNLTELSTSEQLLSLPGKDMTGKYLFFLTLLENQNKKTVEFMLSCSSESDKQRWIEALSPPKSEDPNEVLYECWDCPQVTVVHNYVAAQPDEMNLSKGDIMNVSRKMADGWYQGERIRDGQTGWFPANYTKEIANPHVRARNLRQRYRLLTFSENYLKNKS